LARYRKIDPRIWNDENFVEAEPLHKLIWFALLTHPQMTPMGAGVIPDGVFDSIIGNTGMWCWRCQDNCDKHRAETILGWLSERFMTFSTDLGGSRLIIVKKFLIYNTPDNPNQLAGWIESIEELPRSALWRELRDHLSEVVPALPSWLFSGLLNPLADNKLRGLKALFWERVGEDKKSATTTKAKPSSKPSAKPLPKPYAQPSHQPSRNQEQEQEQEQDIERGRESADAPPSNLLNLGEFGMARMTQDQHAKLLAKLNGSLETYIASFDRWVHEAPNAKAGGSKRRDRHAYESILAWYDRDVKEGKVKKPQAQRGYQG
jgi:hypothetical protein